MGFVDAGAISTDGVTLSANTTEPETYQDWNGNVIDASEATSAQSIEFSVLETTREAAAELVFAKSSITSAGGEVTKISGTGNPTNKVIVVDTRIKNKRHRVILAEASFAGRGDDSVANDALYAWNVTYNALTDADGNDVIRLYADLI